MLNNLHVKNFALISEAEIDLSDRLNILTGETGAGKSIILGAVNLALGARTSKDVVKEGTEYSLAELTFTGLNDNVRRICEEECITIEDDELVLSRKLQNNGKSIIRINGETVSASVARKISSELIDVYGQNEHQSLTDNDKQLELIDAFRKEETAPLLAKVKEASLLVREILSEMDGLDDDEASRAREIDRLQFEIDEITEADIKEDEEEQLKEEHKLLANSLRVMEALNGVAECLGGDNGASDCISQSIRLLSKISDVSSDMGSLYDRAQDIDALISDLESDISHQLDNVPLDDTRLQEVEERLDLISHIKGKYGRTVSEINDFLAKDSERLEKLLSYDSYAQGLKDRLDKAQKGYDKASDKLTTVRRESAEQLSVLIAKALADLNFNKTEFVIVLQRAKGYSVRGKDEVEFLISLNPGSEPKPLAKIASGGELSRIMLAIKSVMASRGSIDTLIFDEIDTGISGRTAQMVAEKLAVISDKTQVICITHLSQIAAMADEHILIEKSVTDDDTHVAITTLDETGINDELSRMLGGAAITEAVKNSAAELKNLASDKKKLLRA